MVGVVVVVVLVELVIEIVTVVVLANVVEIEKNCVKIAVVNSAFIIASSDSSGSMKGYNYCSSVSQSNNIKSTSEKANKTNIRMMVPRR